MKEQAVAFGPDRSSIGVLADPPAELRGRERPAFLFLNSGVLPRVGPNRLHVDLSRRLAQAGFPAFRFDLSGIGDSPASGGAEDVVVRRFIAETRAAMDFLKAARNVDRFIAFGNCSGAGVAFLTALEEPRLAGVAMINPQGPRVKRYLLRLATNRTTWRRAVHGALRREAVEDVARQTDLASADERTGLDLAQEFRDFVATDREVLLVFSEWDPGLDYFSIELSDAVEQLRQRESYHVIRGLNHDFDLVAGQRELMDLVLTWAQRFA